MLTAALPVVAAHMAWLLLWPEMLASGRCSYGLVALVVADVSDVALVDVVVQFWWFVDVPIGLVVLGGE